MLLHAFRLSTSELECWCHRNLCLLFPSFMLYASESSIKMVLRVCTLAVRWRTCCLKEGTDRL